MFGDRPSDLQAALAAGIPNRVLLGTDGPEEPDDVFPAASPPSASDRSRTP